MKAVQTYRGDWVVQYLNGISRPGVFDSEQAALDSMHFTNEALQAIYTPMRNGGSPLTTSDLERARENMHQKMKAG